MPSKSSQQRPSVNAIKQQKNKLERLSTTSFLDMLKLEKTVHLENTDSSSKIQVHSPLLRQSKFFQILIIPHREKS